MDVSLTRDNNMPIRTPPLFAIEGEVKSDTTRAEILRS